MNVLESYADWSFAEIEVKYSKKDNQGNSKEYSKKVYFVIDQYGRTIKWNLIKTLLEKDFKSLCKQIKKLE